jgi:hypothetical protein
MDILWQPESGICSHCGRRSKVVRRFTTDRYHVFFCFTCWSKAQQGKQDLIVNRSEWKDDTAMTFEVSENYGNTQGCAWN